MQPATRLVQLVEDRIGMQGAGDLQGFEQERVLAPEPPEEGHLVHAGGLGDLSRGGSAEPELAVHARGGGKDASKLDEALAKARTLL